MFLLLLPASGRTSSVPVTESEGVFGMLPEKLDLRIWGVAGAAAAVVVEIGGWTTSPPRREDWSAASDVAGAPGD